MKKFLLSNYANIALLFIVFVLVSPQKTQATQQQDPPPTMVTLENGYRIYFLGVSNDFDRGISTWNYRVEELPSAQDLSVWMLKLLDCHKKEDIITATPTSWWYEDPDPNMRLTGIKWQGAGVAGSATFSVTLKGHWEVGTVQVSAKGPDVASGFLAGPSCQVFTPKPAITPIITFLLHNSQTLYINEFMASKAGTLSEPDWIEIHNSGDIAVNLQNFYLTNDLSSPTKYRIPAGTMIPAGGFVIFYADNNTGQGPYHTNFNLATTSGDIGLFMADGTTVVDSYTYNVQTADQTEGRCPDGDSSWIFFAAPTPNMSNGTCQ